MRALYLYFAESADPRRDRTLTGDDARPAQDGPLVPIGPGAFARWKANRDRVVAENASAYRRAIGDSLRRLPRDPLTTG